MNAISSYVNAITIALHAGTNSDVTGSDLLKRVAFKPLGVFLLAGRASLLIDFCDIPCF